MEVGSTLPRKWNLLVLAPSAMALAMMGFGQALAGSVSDSSASDDEWSVTLSPYLWAAAYEGDVGLFQRVPPVHVDESFRNILKDFKKGAMGTAEVRHDRLGLFADFFYVDLETKPERTPGPLFGSVTLESKTYFVTSMLAYRVFDDGRSSLDVMAGLRLWHHELKFDISSGLLAGQSFSDQSTWLDPTIGTKGQLQLSDEFALEGWGIIGGSNAGSKFMWDAFGGARYNVTDWFSVMAGYRGTGTDYKNGGFVYDVVLHGPIFFAVFEF